jgi:hypothetical protein
LIPNVECTNAQNTTSSSGTDSSTTSTPAAPVVVPEITLGCNATDLTKASNSLTVTPPTP